MARRYREAKSLEHLLDRMKAEDDEEDRLKALMKMAIQVKETFGLYADEVEEDNWLQNFLLLDGITQIRLGEHASESRLFLSCDDVMMKQAEAAKTDVLETMESDYEAYTASTFRDDWMAVWSRTAVSKTPRSSALCVLPMSPRPVTAPTP
ncbi:hypothetical protein PVAP13_2NG573720 [Panicum virgatum]|uniref:Uncharacterized protein n=1 Tax=Panicum virgatum TaxID=38727 RepID=A0A8T0W0L6_PANVG|nr:hypothetical protein PVAP13_2NG573720 [Panicum virgatum]